MTDDQHGEGTPQGGGRWNPLPQGDYDDGATAFVKLPEGGIDALLAGDSPLAAPGHGYVPPRIAAAHAAPDDWPVPDGGGRWPDANAAPAQPQGTDDRFTYQPGATQHWTFEEPAAPAAPGHDVTGQWSIPVAGGDLPDESGEYTTSSLVEQWGGTPPATLPGGAPAPWATDGAGRAWGRTPAQPAAPDHTDLPDHTGAHPAGGAPAPEAYAPEAGYGHGTGYADPGHTESGRTDAGHTGNGHADAGHAGSGHVDAGHAGNGHVDAGHAGNGRVDAGRAGGGFRDAGHAEGGFPDGHVDAGHAEGAFPGAGHGEGGHPDAGQGEGEHPDDAHPRAGHADAGHADAGHGEGGHADAGHGEGGHPDAGDGLVGYPDVRDGRAGHADAGDGDTHGGTDLSAVPGEPVPAARPQAGPGAAAGADVHGLAETPERPADASAGDERSADPAAAPRPATAAATADPAAPEGPVTAGHPAPQDDPAATAGTPDPESAGASPAAPPRDGTAVPGTAVPGTAVPGTAEAPAEAHLSEDEAAQETDPEGAGDPDAVPLPPHDDHPLASYVLRVNGADRPVTDAWIGESLLYVLRERLGLAGAKDGCSQGECGACNVQVDGRLVASCLVPAVTAAGSEVRTVEGLAADGRPSDVQRALARCGAVQCGFCVPGMAMTVHDLLEGNPAPTELETRQALCGNLCRCSGYRGVLEAVKEVVAEREASHAGPGTDADEARIPHQAGPGSGGVHPSAFDTPGVFDTPKTAPDGYGDTQGGAYGDPPDPYGTPPGPQDQHYGQDGGQA
ncbi:2Fe-2S iron-sulfur cluster-binding protein [Streptomyces echinatus]|uniref:2Fe-2S iron-sulfur cluster-binding protein n=1 Tax=Streptomyces echinatus TaxID=67293 RepID=UPI0037FB6E45